MVRKYVRHYTLLDLKPRITEKDLILPHSTLYFQKKLNIYVQSNNSVTWHVSHTSHVTDGTYKLWQSHLWGSYSHQRQLLKGIWLYSLYMGEFPILCMWEGIFIILVTFIKGRNVCKRYWPLNIFGRKVVWVWFFSLMDQDSLVPKLTILQHLLLLADRNNGQELAAYSVMVLC